MRTLLVNGKVLDRSVVTLEVLYSLARVRVPHDDVSFLATTCNKTVLMRVNECIDAFLMQVKGLLQVRQVIDAVDVNEAVQRR